MALPLDLSVSIGSTGVANPADYRVTKHLSQMENVALEFLVVAASLLLYLGPPAAAAWFAYRRRWREAGTFVAVWAFLVAYVIVITLGDMQAAARRKPYDRTRRTIDAAARQIRTYMREHRVTPPNLPAAAGGKTPSTDAWGHELGYSVDKDGVVMLGSYGLDGKGPYPYLTFRFRTRRADGSLNVDEGPIDWIGREPVPDQPHDK